LRPFDLRAMFGFAADKKAEEIDADIRRRIHSAFELVPVDSTGRGLHSSTFQLNLSRF
jgi:hypothetical protein